MFNYTLLNPGPVNVSRKVRMSLLRGDICHREEDFSLILKNIQRNLLSLFASEDYSAILLSGSGTAALEMAISSALSPRRKILIINNGIYGERMVRIAKCCQFPVAEIKNEWFSPPSLNKVTESLKNDPKIEIVALVHHETTTGLINPVPEIGRLARQYNKTYLVDSISGLGGEEIKLKESGIDICVGTANKCIQGLPGVSFLLITHKEIERISRIPAASFYLDLYKYYLMEKKGETPFTPAVPVFYALEAALEELGREGVTRRIKRYQSYARILRKGFRERGLKFLLQKENLSNTITALYLPPETSYERIHSLFKKEGFIIYAGQGDLKEKIFRVANMGDLKKERLRKFISLLKKN